jgi:hypothetical protein
VLIPLGDSIGSRLDWRAGAPRRLVGHHVPLFRVRADVSDIVEARRRSTALHPLPVPTRHQAAIEPLHQRVVLDVTTFADAYDYDIREWDSVEVLRKFVRVDVEGGLYECDWTAACLDLVGEGADRVGVVQWFTSHGPKCGAGRCRRGTTALTGRNGECGVLGSRVNTPVYNLDLIQLHRMRA